MVSTSAAVTPGQLLPVDFVHLVASAHVDLRIQADVSIWRMLPRSRKRYPCNHFLNESDHSICRRPKRPHRAHVMFDETRLAPRFNVFTEISDIRLRQSDAYDKPVTLVSHSFQGKQPFCVGSASRIKNRFGPGKMAGKRRRKKETFNGSGSHLYPAKRKCGTHESNMGPLG